MATTFYKSKIVAFVGSENNDSFTSDQFVLWDDMRKVKIGMIILKNKISDFKLTKDAVFLLTGNKILMFEMCSLKFVNAIEDVQPDLNKTSFTVLNNMIVLAYSSLSNPSMIKINKCKILFLLFSTYEQTSSIKSIRFLRNCV